MSFGERLKVLIEEREITQKELAKAFNIAASTMGCYVQNTREPDFSTLKALADFFDVSTDYLLERPERSTDTRLEAELLRIFRTLTPEQQELYVEQGRAFVKINAKNGAGLSGSAPRTGNKAG